MVTFDDLTDVSVSIMQNTHVLQCADFYVEFSDDEHDSFVEGAIISDEDAASLESASSSTAQDICCICHEVPQPPESVFFCTANTNFHINIVF